MKIREHPQGGANGLRAGVRRGSTGWQFMHLKHPDAIFVKNLISKMQVFKSTIIKYLRKGSAY